MKTSFCAFILIVLTSGRSLSPILEVSAKPVSRADASVPSWANSSWTDDNTKARSARIEIERLAHNPAVLKSYTLAQKTKLGEYGTDRDVVFRFAYSAYRAYRSNDLESTNLAARAKRLLNNNFESRNFEWVRLRYLMEMQYLPSPQLKAVGFRLIQREPRDYDVKYFYAAQLNLRDASERQLAIRYTDDLLKAVPKKSSAYTAAGSLYFNLWGLTGDKEFARESIGHYRQYLRVVPKNDSFRSHAEGLIRLMQDELNKSAKTKG